MNNEIVENRWQYVREELNKFQKKYLSVNKDTQDKIQDLFDSLNITYQDLSKPISKKDKDRLKRKISKWKKEGIFRGYFKFHTEELMKGTITYRSVIEILLYGIEMEEQKELSDSISTLFISSSLSCYNQGRKDLRKKEISILPQVLLTTFVMTAVNGIMWKDYIDAFYLTNMQEIQRRYLISLQQNKEPNIYDDTWQKTFEIQRNRLIDINKIDNEVKYSGGIDKYVTTYGNMAYIDAGSDGNQKVMFVSDKCDHVTAMCSYMDGMIFNTKDRNIFKRPMGKTARDLVLQTLDVKGLIIGINQPPIEEHFHWCHSTLTYLYDENSINENKEDKVPVSGDDKEQYERYKKYYGNEIPDTVEKFVDLKYNNADEWEYLKRNYNDRKLRYKIRNEYNLKVNEQHFNKHKPGTYEYNQRAKKEMYPSEIYLTIEEEQQLINKYAGYGKFSRNLIDGSFQNKEQHDFKKVIGKMYSKEEQKYVNTTKGTIHYSKEKGTHIVPRLD